MPEATEWSTTQRPVSRASTSSLWPTQRRAAANSSGLVLAEPHELGQRRHRMKRRAGALVQAEVLVAQALGLLGRARIGPGDQPRQGPVAGVQGEQPVHRRADAEPADLGAALAGPGRGAGDDLEHGLDDHLGVLLGPPVLGLDHGAAGLGVAELAPVAVEGDRLGARRADVDAEDDLRPEGGGLTGRSPQQTLPGPERENGANQRQFA